MNIKHAAVFFLATFFFCGCYLKMKSDFLAREFKTEQISIPFKPEKITMIDRRIDISNRDIKIPAFSLPGQKDKIVPPLIHEHRACCKTSVFVILSDSEGSPVFSARRKGFFAFGSE